MQDTLYKVKISPFPFVRIFLIIYLIMNLVGMINFPIYLEKIENRDVFFVFLIGLIGFLSGVLLFRNLKLGFKKTEPNFAKTNIIKILFLFFNIITFCFIAYTNIRSGGIIIFSEDDRFTIFAITNIFIYITIIMTMVYYANKLLQNKKVGFWDILFLIIQSFLFLSLGFRSPVISLLGGFFVIFYSIRNDYQDRFKKVFTWKILFGTLVFIVFMSSVASFRVSRKYDVDKYFKNIDKNVLERNNYLRPIVPTLALFRFDQEVVDKLIEKTKGRPMYMGLALSNIITILPGEQEGARNIIGGLTNAPKKADGKSWSITPTLQGAFFVDGGYVLVFFGFFITALVMEIIRKAVILQKNPFIFALYGFMILALLKCIHTGYEDVTFFIIIFILFVLKFLVYNINYSIKKMR